MSDVLVLQKITEVVERTPGRRILLSTLGLLLRQQLPGFLPSDYGHRTLKDLLRALPDLAVLTRGEHPGQWWLTLRAADEVVDTAVSAPEKLLPQVWNRVIDFDSALKVWFDLENERLSEDGEAVASEPDRYLALPRFPLTRQIELAKVWCALQDEASRHSLLTSLDDESSLDGFLAETTRLKLRPDWNLHRRRIITDELRAWAHDHGISAALLFGSERRSLKRPPNPGEQSQRPPVASAGGVASMALDEFRRFLHHMIDAMTVEELLHISVPGRFLVRVT